jgi:hypothetical protein
MGRASQQLARGWASKSWRVARTGARRRRRARPAGARGRPGPRSSSILLFSRQIGVLSQWLRYLGFQRSLLAQPTNTGGRYKCPGSQSHSCHWHCHIAYVYVTALSPARDERRRGQHDFITLSSLPRGSRSDHHRDLADVLADAALAAACREVERTRRICQLKRLAHSGPQRASCD